MSVDEEPLDVVTSGPAEPDPRRRRAVLGALALLLVIAAVAGLLDLRSRRGEYQALTRCAARGTAAVQDATVRVSATAEYTRPSLAFATEPTATGLYALIALQAQEPAGDLRRARAACAAVDVLPWHGSLRVARVAQIGYLDGVLDRLAATAGNGRSFFRDPPFQPELAGVARAALLGARPPLS